MPLDGRLMSAFVKRAEQLKKWQDSETNKTSADIPKHRPSRIKFPDGCVFLAACASGDKEEVQNLLDQGADVNTINVDGLTALHQACIDGNLDMVEFLVENGADVNRQDNEGWTPLHATVSCGSVAIAEYLIQNGANLGAINNDGELPIDLAESEAIEEFLQAEMNKREIDCDSVRTLEEKIMLEDARKWFRTKQIEDNIHSHTGATALHVAAAKGYGEVLGLLIRAGADLNAQDYDGWTPMHAAAHWGQRIACRMLAENLANMTIQNNVGQTCFDVADEDMVKLLEELKKMQESMEKERPEIKEILQRQARCPPMRKTSINRMTSAEKITNRTIAPATEREVIKVKFSPIVESKPPKVDRREENELSEEIPRIDGQPVKKRSVSPVKSLEKEVPWRRPRKHATPPPEDRIVAKEESESEEEEEEEEIEMDARNPGGEEFIYKSSVPPVPDERSEMQRKAHAKRARETRRPTQGVTSEELKLAQRLLLQKMAQKELEPGSGAQDSEEEEDEEEEEEKDEKFASRYASSGSLPETRASGASSLASSSEDLPAGDYKKLYFELKEENDKLREKLRISEENLEKTKEQLQKALQNNSRNEIERKERRSLERKISEMEEELKSLAKVKNENEKLKAENRALTRTVSKLTKKCVKSVFTESRLRDKQH